MTNFTQLQDGAIWALGSGIDASDFRVKWRYGREGELIQASARAKDFPQTEAVHAAIALLIGMAGGGQTRIVDRVKELWHMPRLRSSILGPVQSAGLAVLLSNMPASDLEVGSGWQNGTFGDVISKLIGGIATQIEDGSFNPQQFQQDHLELIVSHNGEFAVLTGGRDVANQPALWFRSKNFIFSGGAVSTTAAPSFVLIQLAHLVAASRKEAKKRGIEIPVEETYRALGVDHQPSPRPKSNLSEGEALPNADPTLGDVPKNDERHEDGNPRGVRLGQPTTSLSTLGAWQPPMVSERGEGNQPPPMPSTDRLPAFTIEEGARCDDAREDSAHRIAA